MAGARYGFTITGASPLLMKADNIEWADELTAWQKDPKNKNVSKKGDDRSPAWTWIGGLYSDGENVTIPVENLQKCLSQAGARIILKGSKTFKEIAVSGLWIEQDALPVLVAGKPVPYPPLFDLKEEDDFTAHLAAVRKAGFTLFMKRAKVGTSKHIRVRPRFDEWAVSGSVEVEAPELTADVVKELFRVAGRVGLGDWRPGCSTPGRFGMFTAAVKPIK